MDNFSENPLPSGEAQDCDPVTKEVREAVAYFQARPGLGRLLDGWVQKYRSLGRLGGYLSLNNLDTEEREALEAFFRQRLPEKQVRVSGSEFVKSLAETRFGEVNPIDLLRAWHGGELITRQEQRERDEHSRQAVLRQLMEQFPQRICETWLRAIRDKEPDTRQTQRGLSNERDFCSAMTVALQAITNLPEDYRRMPVFARNICGDPHGLDPDHFAGRLFLEGLRFIRKHEESNDRDRVNEETSLSPVEEHNELLYHFKLVRDDVLNFATCYGLIAYVDGCEIPYWRMAATSGAPLNAPLREIVQVTCFRPYRGGTAAPPSQDNYDVFIVENSGVFSALLDETISAHPQLVCLHGQFKLASWALLDRLTHSGAMIHYSGDFDPEGLQMAEKLLLRYPGQVRLWRMTKADYLRAAPSVTLEENRLRKLSSIRLPELKPLAEAISIKRSAAYQEGILGCLSQDVVICH